MMKNGFFLGALLASSLVFAGQTNFERVNAIPKISRLAFGSCNHQTDHQPLWKDIADQKPDLWIWGGDNIYVDSLEQIDIKLGYATQNKNKDYQDFKAKVPFIGTWDDHDFAYNNADFDVPWKSLSQQYFLDFMEEPMVGQRRFQQGVYTSYSFGEAAERIKIILLDNRFFLKQDPKAPMLGEKQWIWLDQELRNNDANLTFIMSGLSIISPALSISEEWADEPRDLNRLLDLLKKHKTRAPVFLTGDKHFSSIFMNYGHLEFMSSGMTHTLPRGLRSYVSKRYPNTFFGLNYGLIDITWSNGLPVLSMGIRTISRQTVTPRTYKWDGQTWQLN
jgi:alkaline phosphatase D